MFGSVVLEVTLGLVFVYAWFSLICSAIVESLESMRAQRGKMLALAIERMLGGELKQKFYQHGLIRALSRSNRLPSYLPWQLFGTVTLDVLGVSAAQFRQQLDEVPGEIGTTLRALTRHAKSLDEVALALEHWFEQAMDRCSGWFRRRTRAAAFATGFVVAALLNVDSIEIATVLYSDTHLRLSMVTQAESEGQVPARWRSISGKPVVMGVETCTAEKCPSVMSIPIETGTLPLGWENSRFASRGQWSERAWAEPAFWFGPVLTKILGLLATAFAGSLGAAFWFEALRRVTILRSAATPRLRTLASEPLAAVGAMVRSPSAPTAAATVSPDAAPIGGESPAVTATVETKPID